MNPLKIIFILAISIPSLAEKNLVPNSALLKYCIHRVNEINHDDISNTLLAMRIFEESQFSKDERGCCGQEEWKIKTPNELPQNLKDIIALSERDFIEAQKLVKDTDLWGLQIVAEPYPYYEGSVLQELPEKGKRQVEVLLKLSIKNTNTDLGMFKVISDEVYDADASLNLFDPYKHDLYQMKLFEIPQGFSCTRKLLRLGF